MLVLYVAIITVVYFQILLNTDGNDFISNVDHAFFEISEENYHSRVPESLI
ncbi:hypothetical protein C1645_881595 [Glomus cerebriforme]|uniref:Uncharacterized protein n=1 Tax=Glomus cerebriforme TaxID=658196 RepID=A0A397S4Z1_9GLOM|nr:hypothetical protein C1645_881595 [Glomus cerebriforme]